MARSQLALVLHAHLPYVRHPEHRYFLEENWLFEAVTATYLPLLEVMRNLVRDGVRFRLTLSLSPPLVTMLGDPELRERTSAYLDRLLELGDLECARLRGDSTFGPLARFYRDRFGRLKALYEALRGDLIEGFRKLQDDGLLEIITVGATHGYLPVIREPAARRAQIKLAAESYQRHFGRWPRGIWLPECGYAEGVDALLAEHGIRYFFVDAHGLLFARPQPPYAIFAPAYTKHGVAAFARDLESSKQVWSSKEGYPGDAAYRDFYRDIGFDRPQDYIAPFIHPDGIRVHTGYKYFRVTGEVDLGQKQPYDPEAARERAAQHAAHFLGAREQQTEHLAERMDREPIVVSPYDAELFGHWWFEGPDFLDALIRNIGRRGSPVALATPSDYLHKYPTNAVVEVAPSSWGDGGFSKVWIDGSNDWIYRHVHRAERRMVELARAHEAGAAPLEARALNQAARELLLAQASDWAFIMKTGTAVDYACRRVKSHLARLRRLDQEIAAGHIDEAWLADLERRDNIFPELDYRTFLG
ncbi:MAG TPA: 1,4-alpha-glucan branching protein domain-containing protein [Polyangia bacterium]|nr:1,4-alpha-glucan branching protein domain-containing protein [Polyangia bacterium]